MIYNTNIALKLLQLIREASKKIKILSKLA